MPLSEVYLLVTLLVSGWKTDMVSWKQRYILKEELYHKLLIKLLYYMPKLHKLQSRSVWSIYKITWNAKGFAEKKKQLHALKIEPIKKKKNQYLFLKWNMIVFKIYISYYLKYKIAIILYFLTSLKMNYSQNYDSLRYFQYIVNINLCKSVKKELRWSYNGRYQV